MKRYIDLTGKKFGKLTVIGKADTRVSESGHYIPYWYCVCDCQMQFPEEDREIIKVQARKLREGATTSCGCMRRLRHKKENRYEVNGDVVTMYDSKGYSFLIDLEDLDRVREYCWKVSERGYVQTTSPMVNGRRTYIPLHRFVMNCTDHSMVVDHINHNTSDNRKCNLRICTPTQNQYNVKPSAYNKSGVRGVRFNKYCNKWEVGFTLEGKHRIIGYFNNINDAIKLRKQYEEKYYGEYAYKGD